MRHRAPRSLIARLHLRHRPRTVLTMLSLLVLGLVAASVVTASGPRDGSESASQVPVYPGASYDPPTPSVSDSSGPGSRPRPSDPATIVASPSPSPSLSLRSRPTGSPVSRSGERNPEAATSRVKPSPGATPTATETPESPTPAPDPPTADAPQTTATTRSAHAGRWVIGVAADTDSTFECSLDGGAYQPCGSKVTYDGLDEGTHTFSAQATDAGGNTDPTPAQLSAEVDGRGNG